MLISETEWLLIDCWRAVWRRRTLSLAAAALLGVLVLTPAHASGGSGAFSRPTAGLPTCSLAFALPADHFIVLCEEGR